MKILSLSLDSLVLIKESVVASRCVRYGSVVDSFTVIVPTKEQSTTVLSPQVTVYGTGGTHKLVQLWNMYQIARTFLRTEKNVVISSQDSYFLGLLALILARRYQSGLEIQVLGIEKLSIFRKMLSKFVLKKAGSIRVLSIGLQKRLIKEFGISQTRMIIVPIYVDVSSLGLSSVQSEEEQKKINEANSSFNGTYKNRFNIVSVSRLVPIKNISMQLQAVATLRREFPDMLLHIVGDGPLKESIQAEITTLKLREHVILEGFKSGADLSPFFTQSDCFVLTSDFEGYGMVIIEAATAGLPIVMTDVGCAGEVIINEKSGMIVPAKDTQAFTQALRKVLTDSALRASLKEGALHSIAELPSFDTVLEKYTASWQQALQNRY